MAVSSSSWQNSVLFAGTAVIHLCTDAVILRFSFWFKDLGIVFFGQHICWFHDCTFTFNLKNVYNTGLCKNAACVYVYASELTHTRH